MYRKTKIICTVGPSTDSFKTLEALYEAGMSIMRINMSHADHDQAAQFIHWIKTLNRKVRYPVPIMLDTRGPEVRTGTLDAPMELRRGETVILDVLEDGAEMSTEAPNRVFVNYPDLPSSIEIGGRVRLDNGLINLYVVDKDDTSLTCRVFDGGRLGSRKHVNLPGVHVNLPSITEQDKHDIAFGLEQEIDFIALSFVRSENDIFEARELLGPKAAKTVRIIAKIENQAGVENVEEIATAADAVMVARGDLGIETDIAKLPTIQRELVKTCARLGKRCIMATQLLESMIESPIPSRAEVTDVANAIYEGVDATMLSGETSIGDYPVRCVEQLSRIALESERQEGFDLKRHLAVHTEKQHIAASAVSLAEAIGVAGIVVITRRGVMADFVTNCHPEHVPIYAFTNNSQTRRRLMLNRGVFSHRTAFSKDPERTIRTALSVLGAREGLRAEDRVVVISDMLADIPIDSIQVRRVGARE